MKRLKMLVSLLFLAVLVAFPPNGSSCGPFFPSPVFVNKDRPGAPLEWYAQGHLGVVLPGFTRSYLVIAYRYLSGRPLSQEERNAALEYWRWKYQRDWGGDGSDNSGKKDPVTEWLGARRQTLTAATGAVPKEPAINDYQGDQNGFGGWMNCLADSYRTAALTLNDRVRRFGNDKPAIVEWIKGQDVVFQDCSQNKEIPSAAPESSPEWLKADRRYQIAAAHFYSRSFDQAAQDFDGIAADSGSPWKTLAPYLAARAMIRKGMLSADPEALRDAEARLRKIVNDPAQSQALRDSARRLAGYIALRSRREERNIELARALAGHGPDPDFQQDLVDYNWSLEHLTDEPPERGPEPGGPTEEYRKRYQEWVEGSDRRQVAARAGSEMTDWVMNLSDSGAAASDHAVAEWRRQRSLPWLVAALTKISAENITRDKDKDKTVGELLKAAEEVRADSPAYPTVTYHRVRLLIQSRNMDKARSLLDAFLSASHPHLTASSENLFLGQRMRAASDFQDFLVHAPRPVADVDTDDGFFGACSAKTCDDLLHAATGGPGAELRFDGEAAAVLNFRLPLELMAQAGKRKELPKPLRGEMAVAAWTRAVMLDRHDVAAALAPEIQAAYPAVKEQMESYVTAKPEDKKYAALFAILHLPGMRPYVNAGAARQPKIDTIDSYRDNWWCADIGANVATNYAQGVIGTEIAKPGIPDNDYPQFLSPDQAYAAEKEWQALAKSGTAPIFLTSKTLAWAEERPDDPRLAEALHYAVRSTRYGCEDAAVGTLSKKAFTLLHTRFPDSTWAKQTPYWFGRPESK